MKTAGSRYVSCAFMIAVMCVSVLQAQAFKVIYSFAGGSDGSTPLGWLIADAKGNLYGTTVSGGAGPLHCPSGCGTVFMITPSGQETILHRFQNLGDGARPGDGLSFDAAGELYGTSAAGRQGGHSVGGAIFRLDPVTAKLKVLYDFSDGADGGVPESGVILDAHGNLYGTTFGGGERKPSECQLNGCGVVFKLNTRDELRVLHRFRGTPDGWAPQAGLIRDAAGNLYGTTNGGGTGNNCNPPSDCGTVFKVDRHGKETILHNFTSSPDGEAPDAALIMDDAGNLYGTTVAGGVYGLGTIFRMDPADNVTVLHSFAGPPDGADPVGGVVRDSAGNLYGATYAGGDAACGFEGSGCGSVYRLDVSGNLSILHAFSGGADGGGPLREHLLLDSAGNLYGTTMWGGIPNNGVVFEITP